MNAVSHPETDPAAHLGAGTPIGERYQIEDYVASGGMGFIYRGVDRTSGERVAIKVMRAQLRRDESAVKRFKREAETVLRLSHNNTIRLFEYGTSEGGHLYIAMEWLDGHDLAEHIERYGSLSPPRAAFMGACIARALAEAHRKGIIHRDLKPENIFLVRTYDGNDQIKVLDFGIAKVVGGPAATQITRIGMVCGTPDFMSPEQGRGEDLDGRSDIYAVGCLLYTLLTGNSPFPGDTPLKIVMRHQLEPFPALPQHLPGELERIIQRACAKDRAERWPDADSFASALDAFLIERDSALYENRGTGIMPAMSDEMLQLMSGDMSTVGSGPGSTPRPDFPATATTPASLASMPESTGRGNPARQTGPTMGGSPHQPTAATMMMPATSPGRQQRSVLPFVILGVLVALAMVAVLVLLNI